MTRPLSWRGKTPVDVTHLAPEGERLAVVLLRAAMNAARTMGLPLGATDVAALWDHRHGLRAIVGAEGLRLDALLAAAPTAGAAPRLVVADLDADGVELAPPALDVPIVVAFHREAEMLTRVELVGRAAWASARRIGLEVHSDVVDPSAYLAEIRRLVETADWDSA